ncbi:MAG: ABC transporter substrate-binding protein [Candidatus Curtissbacteria bacterium]|nr:ABC transporter substrate-binding protein [Candidatus Curtissbacteria bacterium]
MEFVKKNLIAFIVILILAVIVISGQKLSEKKLPKSAGKPQELTQVKLGKSPVPVHALAVNVTKKKGIFAKNGLDVEDSALIGGNANALASGQVDYQVQIFASFLASDVKGSEARWISTVLRADKFYLLSNKEITSIKKVGINRLGGEDYYETVMAMKLAGIPLDNIEFVTTGGYEGKLPILLKGGVDVVGLPLIAGLSSENFEKDGLRVLFDLAEGENSYYPVGLLALEKTIKNNPETVQKISESLAEGVAYAREETRKNEIISMIISDYSVDQKNAQEIYDGFLAGTDNLDPVPREDFVRELLKLMEKDIPEAKDYDPLQFIAEDKKAEIYLQEGYGI